MLFLCDALQPEEDYAESARITMRRPPRTRQYRSISKPCITPNRNRASPGLRSYYAVRSGQAAAKRMILWPAPSTRAQPARAEPLPVQSIKQPQLDLHSRLHNLGTYRVKAPGRDPLWQPRRKEQAVAALMADQPSGGVEPGGRSSVKARLTPNRRRRRSRTTSTPGSFDASCGPTRGESQEATLTPWPT